MNKPIDIWGWIKIVYWIIVSMVSCFGLGFWIAAGMPAYPYSNLGVILGILFWISTTIIILRLPPGRSME